MSNVLFNIIIWVAVLGLLRQNLHVAFYKAYFRRKQKELKNDPDVVLQREFPWIWWVIR
jgi:hypothetical protein